MATSTFSNQVKIGKNTGAPSTSTIGYVTQSRVVSTSAAASARTFGTFKAGTQIIDIVHNVGTAFAGTGGQLQIGTASDATKFGNIPVSAVGSVRTGVSAGAYYLAADTEIILNCVPSSAGAAGEGKAVISYVNLLP